MKKYSLATNLSLRPLFPVLLAAATVLLPCFGRADLFRLSQIIDFPATTTYTNLGQPGLEGWTGSTSEVAVTNGIGSLSYPGLLASAGDRADIGATASLTTYNLFAASGTFPANRTTNIYYSFLYQFKNADDVDAGGERIIQVNRQNSGSAYTLQLQARNVAGQLQIGILKTNGTVAWASSDIPVGATCFVVMRHQVFAGAGNDIADLWVNPSTNTFGADEASVPTPDATATDGGEDASNTGPGRFFVASGSRAIFDELRVGNNWAEVTPPAGICDPAAITLEPTNQVFAAGLSTTISVGASGTARTYQWEVSTNSGTTWNDVSTGTGGTSPNYRTPVLTVANSGVQYRCRVAVTCGGGSSALSEAATMTVTNPVVTPVGVVLDDFFADGIRDNEPIDQSNAVWRTSSSGSLFTTESNMNATPVSGSSVLWLGFFKEEVTEPVHLAIGTALKASLVFTPSEVVSNAGASMRIGLYDYADSGSRPVNDSLGGGSGGQGAGVRGYMLNLNWGTNFSSNTPFDLQARTVIGDGNLMGTTGDYAPLGAGPVGGTLNNAPAFQSGVPYTLDFTVARLSAATNAVTVSISGGGTNWSHTVNEGTYLYPRFDAIGIRPATQESTATTFDFSRLLVQVLQLELPVPAFNITSIQRLDAGSVKLTWNSVANANYHILSRDSLASGSWVTNATVLATSASTSYTNAGIGAIGQRYYRVVGLPYTP